MVLTVLVDLVVVILLLWRQSRPRLVGRRLRIAGPVFLFVVGMLQLTNYTDHHPQASNVALVVLFGLGAVLGALRGLTVRIWSAGLFLLRQATNRYYEALAAIEADQAAGKIPHRPLVKADFVRRRAMMLPEAARYDLILGQRKDGNIGQRLIDAMDAVESEFPPLAGQLPRD